MLTLVPTHPPSATKLLLFCLFYLKGMGVQRQLYLILDWRCLSNILANAALRGPCPHLHVDQWIQVPGTTSKNYNLEMDRCAF